MRAPFVAIELTVFFAAAMTIGADARSWTLDDALGVGFMDDVQLSPDGATALIDVGRADLAHDGFKTSYRLIDLATGVTTAMSAALGHARWSPDSTSIAWISTASDGKMRVVLTDRHGAHKRDLTDGRRDIQNFSWAPNGTTVAAIETARAAKNAHATDRLHWLTLENDYRDTQPAQRIVWLIDVPTRSERALTNDTWSYGGPETDHDPSWSADGKRLALVRQPSPTYGDFEHAQYVTIDTSGTVQQKIVNHPFFAYPGSAAPAFSPHGTSIAYTHTWDGKLPSREDVFVDGRDVTASLDRDLWSCGAGTITWRQGGLLASMMDGVAIRLYRLDPNGSAPRAITGSDGSVLAYSVARNGRIAYIWSTPSQAPELYALDPGREPHQITHLNALPRDLPIAATRYFTWNDASGHTLHGQLTLPASASSAPLIVEPHGGPQCADDAQLSSFGQYLASNGYAYFRPDPPGSDGYGDWSYKAIVGDWGPGSMAADMAGVEAVNASGVGEPARTFIEGGSYGGYLTSWIVTHSDRFRAAVAQVPVTDLMLDYTLSESPNITRRFFGDKPTTGAKLLAEQSPITYVAQAHTPLLIIVGQNDTRAPYVQAIEFYKALVENGAPARMLVDPQAGHGPDDPRGVIQWLSATMAWIAQHGGIAIPDARLPPYSKPVSVIPSR